MFIDNDVPRDRQAQPRAFAYRLGGEEWFEQVLADFFRHAVAGIGDLDPHSVDVAVAAQGDGAAALNGLCGIDQQVL